jgi:hypothetical protein
MGAAGLVAAQFEFAAGPAGAASATVTPWTAAANSAVLGVVAQASGLSLTTTAGQASTAYLQNEAQATSARINLGGLGVLLANSPLCGTEYYPESAQPQPLTADTANGAASTSNNSAAGNEAVGVSAAPEYATAATTPVTQTLSNVVDVTGTATSAVRYLAGTEQEADAAVTENVSLVGGLVQMDGLSWTASQHSGHTDVSTGTFSFGSVTIDAHGIPLTLPSSEAPATVVQEINAVIGLFGLTLVLPVSSTDPATQTVAIGPLQLHFTGSPLDNSLLAPTAKGVSDLENLLATESGSGADCSNIQDLLGQLANPSDTVINVGLGALEGAGGIDLDFGGASADTQAAPDFTDPFDVSGSVSPPLTPLPPVPSAPTTLAKGPSSTAALSVGATSPGSSSSTVASPATPVAAQSPTATQTTVGLGGSRPAAFAASVGDLVRCVTTSPAGSPGCSRGLGSLAAGVVVVLGGGLLAADIRHSHRTRRRHQPRRANG